MYILPRTSQYSNTLKPVINNVSTVSSALSFCGEEKTPVQIAEEAARELFMHTEHSDWHKPLMNKFGIGKERRVFNDENYGKIIIELHPIEKVIKTIEPVYAGVDKGSIEDKSEVEPTIARIIIPALDIDVSTDKYYNPIMQLALDVIRPENTFSGFNMWF